MTNTTTRPRCAYCGRTGPMTKDHIIPRRTGATLLLPCGARNYKWACALCNQLREHADDCPAVAMMALRVAREAGIKPRKVLAAWGYIGGRSAQDHARAKMRAYHRERVAALYRQAHA